MVLMTEPYSYQQHSATIERSHSSITTKKNSCFHRIYISLAQALMEADWESLPFWAKEMRHIASPCCTLLSEICPFIFMRRLYENIKVRPLKWF